MGKHSLGKHEGIGTNMSENKSGGKKVGVAVKICLGVAAVLLAVGAPLAITALNSGVTSNVEKGPEQEASIEDYDPSDDGNIEQEFVIDTEAIVSMMIYEGRAVDLRITATRAAAGIGGGEIDLRFANEADRDYVVELSDMSVAGEGVSGSGEFEIGSMQITSGSVSFKGSHVQEVDDLDLWHATVTIKTVDGAVVETGTCALTGAFD